MNRNEIFIKMNNQELIRHLNEFTPLEEAFRNYYFIHSKKAILDSETAKMAEEITTNFIKNMYSILPDDQTPFFTYGPIAVLKHLRYMPPHHHTHAFVEFFYILQGSCIHKCQDKQYTLSAGDFCFWQHQLPHSIISYDDDFIGLNILIRKPLLQSSIFGMQFNDNPIYQYLSDVLSGSRDSTLMIFHTQGDKNIEHFVLTIYREYQIRDAYWQNALLSTLSLMFIHLIRFHKDHMTSSESMSRNDHVLSILSYLQENSETVTLESVAAHFNYTPAYFSRYIKQKTGSTFSSLILHTRMNRAAKLLTETNLNITHISDLLAFSDASHFTRVFRKHFNLTPKEYRQKFNKF